MAQSHFLYLMLSKTGTGMGKTIRFVTRYGYNHISLSLDPQFLHWVSFARYVRGVPLAGGFVAESPERYLCLGQPVPVKIFRFEISEDRYQKLSGLFDQANRDDCGMVYNTLSALFTPVGIQFSIPGAYTCLQFANMVLGTSHRSIKALDSRHQSQLIFEGDLRRIVPDSGIRCDRYFIRRGPWGSTLDTPRHFARLCYRRSGCW